MDLSEISGYQTTIETEVQRYLSSINSTDSDYQKIKAAFDFIDELTMYEHNPHDQDIISSFVLHKTVCQGYAETMGTLLSRAGVAWGLLTGTMSGGKHAWNIVKMDGSWCYVDAVEPEGELNPFRDYGRLGMTDEMLASLHYVVSPDHSKNLPVCSNSNCNYFWQEDLLVTGYDLNRLEQLKNRFPGQNLRFRCTDAGVYDRIYSDYTSGNLPVMEEFRRVWDYRDSLVMLFER